MAYGFGGGFFTACAVASISCYGGSVGSSVGGNGSSVGGSGSSVGGGVSASSNTSGVGSHSYSIGATCDNTWCVADKADGDFVYTKCAEIGPRAGGSAAYDIRIADGAKTGMTTYFPIE